MGVVQSQFPDGDDALIRRIQDGERAIRELGPSIAESFRPVIEDLQAAQADLAAQQVTLTAQQASLTDAVADIAAIVNQQVTGGVAATSTTSGWAVGTGMGTMASTTIAVPAGYSTAIVSAMASMHFQDTAPNGGWIRAVIAGNAGGEMGGLANLNLGQSAFHTLTVTGLSGGTITLECQVRASAGTGGMSGRIAQIAGSATFLR